MVWGGVYGNYYGWVERIFEGDEGDIIEGGFRGD